MSITFDEIPNYWRPPGVYIEIAPTYDSIGVQRIPTKILVIGQMTDGAAATETLVRCTSAAIAKEAFGAGSLLADMVASLRDANDTQDVYALALADDAAGVAATATLTLTGSPTVTAPLVLYIGTDRVRVAANTGETVTVIAARLAAAVNAAGLIVSAAADAGVITLAVRHKGAFGNDLPARLGVGDEAAPAGLGVALTAFSGGAANPDIADAFAAIGAEWFTDLVVPYTDAATTSALALEMADRYGPMAPKDAHVYLGFAGTFGEASAVGATLNSPFMSLIAANGSASPPWAWAAALAGVCAFHLTNDPARHLRTIELPGIAAPAAADRFTALEQDLLLRDGITTWAAAQDGTVSLERVITTYQKHRTGFDDTAWLDIVVPKTLTSIRYDWRAYLSLNYPRHKLANDGSPAVAAGQPVVTPRLMHGVWAGRCAAYAELGWIDDADATVKASVFERDGTDRHRLNSRQRVQVMGQLMVIAGRLEFVV